MDVVVTSRRCQLTDAFRDHVSEKLNALERLKERIIRAEVMVTCSDIKRQPDQTIRVEITLHGKGPVVRAEATAEDKMAAFEHALDRLKSQILRASDRRKVHRGLRASALVKQEEKAPVMEEEKPGVHTVAGLEVHGDGPLVVREKKFVSSPLTLAQALDEMELVGHDFFLYLDKDSSQPSVVYRRKAYDYGVIHLDVEESA
ncbi:MAG TPA: ribosome-associated translation inhibitor RaiA [Propionibacteriaceae bacterium]|nr:ribosome-associated translation inhibitor RaiA [Propionibacteriaceae bacterium]